MSKKMSGINESVAPQMASILTSPGFTLLLGGALTLIGALGTEWWRANQERKNLSRSLKVEIKECSSSLESLYAAAEYHKTDQVSWESYDTDFGFLRNSSGLELKYLLIQKGVEKLDSDFDDIYSSNCDDIGKLDPDVAKLVIRFYSEYRELQSQADKNMSEIDEYYVKGVEEDYSENDGAPENVEWTIIQGKANIDSLLIAAEKTYDLQQKCLNTL